MCLAVPAEITEITGETACVNVNGNSLRVSIALTPEVIAGDFVLVHAGYAVVRLDPREARETLKLLEEIHEAAAQ